VSPTVKPVNVATSSLLLLLAFLQITLVKEPQFPLKTCKTGFNIVPAETVTKWKVEVATKLYQTSSSAVPLHPVCDWVPPTVVPVVVVLQFVSGLITKFIALAQSSLDGPSSEVNDMLSIAAGGCVPELALFTHSNTKRNVWPP